MKTEQEILKLFVTMLLMKQLATGNTNGSIRRTDKVTGFYIKWGKLTFQSAK